MAQRRMFSKRIVESARFIKMPSSTQNLYFHLGIHADDDGVVEGYNIITQIGATEDDLRILVAKGFITVLNSDLVVFINDWKENNKIRSDRKIDSIYKGLLLRMIPQVELQEPKARADTGKTTGRPMDNQWTAQDRLGKVREGKVRLEEDKKDLPAKADPIPYQRIVDHLNEKTGQHFQAKAKETRKLIKARINDGFTPEQLIQAIDNQVACWKGKTNEKYLRPTTLFKQAKFEERVNGGVPDPSDFKSNQKPDTYKNDAWDDYEKKYDELAAQYQEKYGEVPVNLDDVMANPNVKPKFKADEEQELAELGISSDELPF